MDGRTDGWTDRQRRPRQARRRGAGREGRRGSGGQRWVPPAHSPARDPLGRPGGGCLGILFFFLSLPVRSLAAGVAPAGRTPMGAGKRWPPPGSGSVTSGARRRHHHQPQHPRPCAPHPSRRPEQRAEERRGPPPEGTPPPPPPLRPRPPPRPWRRRRVLSLLPARSRGTL